MCDVVRWQDKAPKEEAVLPLATPQTSAVQQWCGCSTESIFSQRSYLGRHTGSCEAYLIILRLLSADLEPQYCSTSLLSCLPPRAVHIWAHTCRCETLKWKTLCHSQQWPMDINDPQFTFISKQSLSLDVPYLQKGNSWLPALTSWRQGRETWILDWAWTCFHSG